MSETTIDVSRPTVSHHQPLTYGVVSFTAGAVSFFAASGVFITFGGTPPSSTPTATVFGHTGWFVSVTLLAIGTVALLREVESLRAGLAGYLAAGALGLGVLSGHQWATWAWVDVLAVGSDQYELLLDGVIAPFGAGLSVMYGVLVGAGVGFLGWAARHTPVTHRFVGWLGAGIGTVGVLGNIGVLLSASKNALFAGMVLVHPLFYVWALVIAIDMYRRSRIQEEQYG